MIFPIGVNSKDFKKCSAMLGLVKRPCDVSCINNHSVSNVIVHLRPWHLRNCKNTVSFFSVSFLKYFKVSSYSVTVHV